MLNPSSASPLISAQGVMDFNAREIEQYAAILTRYPHFSPPDPDVDEWDVQFYQSRSTIPLLSYISHPSNDLVKWEKSMLRKKHVVSKDAIAYFIPALMTAEPPKVLRPKGSVKINEVKCVYPQFLCYILANLL